MESWVPLKSPNEMAHHRYDVLIIGTGAGGSSALWRLCQREENRNKRIGIIEAGGQLLQTHALNLATMNWPRLINLLNENAVTIDSGHYNYKQIYALGGRTLFWGFVTPRIDNHILNTWQIPRNQMDYYYRLAEDVMDVNTEYWKDSSIQNVMLSRLHNANIIDATNTPVAVNLERTKYGIIQSNPIWSSISMLGYTLSRRPFDLAINTVAIRLLTEGNQATGVEVVSTKENKRYVIKAKKIVIAGGPIETPKLLLQSHINHVPVGHYLVTHSKVVAYGYISRRIFPEILGTLGIIIPGSTKRPYQILCLGPQNIRYNRYPRFETQPYSEWISIKLESYGIVEPRYTNKISINDQKVNEDGSYQPIIDFSYSNQDLRVIEESYRALYKLSEVMGLKLYSSNNLPLIHLTSPGSSYHSSGTCRMGKDPKDSVVDYSGKVHGYPNIFIADNSMLPSIGTANPTLTTVAFSIRTADIITTELIKGI
jgi:choline dehydrogenase-like flavoprotein